MITLQLIKYLIGFLVFTGNEKFAEIILLRITKGKKFFYINENYCFLTQKKERKLFILLPGKGCEWAQKNGGCTMCALSHTAREAEKDFKSSDLPILVDIALAITKKRSPKEIHIFNGGSFLNNNEIEVKTQLDICKIISKKSDAIRLMVESRVEYIDIEIIKKMQLLLAHKKLMVGIGLESQNDHIRNYNIKKGLSKEDYEQAVTKLKDKGVEILTYVFLKPINTNEKEALYEAIKTVKYAKSCGSDEIALEIAFIQKNTLMEKLYRMHLYEPPKLWSVIKLIQESYPFGKVSVGNFDDEPAPIAGPYNCKKCSDKVLTLIQLFRETNDIRIFQKKIGCSCLKQWETSIG